MNIRLTILGFFGFAYQSTVLAAAESAAISPTGSVLKMVLGLAVVLAVMALISWMVKRLLPGATSQNTAVKVVGGVSVGSRERVVVLEVADRWLVVGVAQGQVSSIANLEVGSDQLTASVVGDKATTKGADDAIAHAAFANPIVKPFSEWLKKSANNIKTKG
ncbi:MAG: flagellar biosynthetic protein FliO [Methylophilaceae bacterium]